MITGEVTADGDAGISLIVRGYQGQEVEISAVIDTGFTGSLTLPSDHIQSMAFPWLTQNRAILGNGKVDQFDVYVGSVEWDGEQRRIMIEEAETDPLVGMELMRRYNLNMDNLDGGLVVLRRISDSST